MQTTHSHHLSLHGKSHLHNLSPQLKILSTLLIVISIAFSKIINPFQILSHALIVFLMIRYSRIPLKTYLKRLTIDIPFILFALFLPFLSSGNNDVVMTILSFDVYRTGLLEMLAILFKATSGVSLGIVLTATTTNIEIIYGLQKLKLPSIIIAIMSFSIRYIDVFIDEFKRVKISMQSRGYIEKGIKNLIEKPNKFISEWIITGLYFIKNNDIKYVTKLKKSKRKEYEITDLLNLIKKKVN